MGAAGQDIEIRLAREDELERAGDLAVRAFSRLRGLLTPEGWAAMQKGIRRTTAQDRQGRLLVAELAGELVGSVRYTGPGHGGHVIYPDGFAYVRSLAVSPDHPRQGIGRALMRACIAAAGQQEAEAIGLHVAEANAAARSLYEGMDFRFYRQAPDYFGLPYVAYHLPLAPRGGDTQHSITPRRAVAFRANRPCQKVNRTGRPASRALRHVEGP